MNQWRGGVRRRLAATELVRQLRTRAEYERKLGDNNPAFKEDRVATAKLLDTAADHIHETARRAK